MLDWITLTIELVGLAILLTWIVIPIREFRQILRIVKHKPHAPLDAVAENARRGLTIESVPARRREDGSAR